MKSKTWALLIGAVFVLCLILSFILLRPAEGAPYAEVWSRGEKIRTVDLRVDQTFTVESELGKNVVTVKDGRIAVTEADCPDGYCMARGYCSGGAAVVCLPNRLVIRFTDNGGIDSVVG